MRIVVESPDRIDQAHDLGVPAGVVDHVVQPVVHLAAGTKNQLRIGHGRHVARPRLIVVRVAAGAQHPLDIDASAADLTHEVRHLGGGGDHGHAAAGSGVVAAGDREDGEHDK